MDRGSRLALVVAISENGVIGSDGDLPWRLPAELKHFRRLTMGHIVLMGRKTLQSLPKALDGREMWVLSRDPAFRHPSARRFGHMIDALTAAAERQMLVIGGASVYAEALPHAQTIYLTRVHACVDGDTYFPALDESHWQQTVLDEHPADERHAHAFTMLRLDRRTSASADVR